MEEINDLEPSRSRAQLTLLTSRLWDQGGSIDSLGEAGKRRTRVPTLALAVLPQERNRVKLQEWSLRPGRGSPEGVGLEQ